MWCHPRSTSCPSQRKRVLTMINLSEAREQLQDDVIACVDSFNGFIVGTDVADMKKMLCQIVVDNLNERLEK
jgi:hypothetical protein